MKTSSETKELAAALAMAQSQMTQPKKNAIGNRGKYATLDKVLASAMKPLTDNQISCTQPPFTGDGIVGVTTRLEHSSGQWYESSYWMPVHGKSGQEYGSLITYARKQSLAAFLGLYAEEDDDAEVSDEESKKPDVQAVSPAQLKELNTVLSQNAIPPAQILARYKVNDIKEICVSDFRSIIDGFRAADKAKETI